MKFDTYIYKHKDTIDNIKKNDKWDIEEHSRNVAKANPMILVVLSILLNVFSVYKTYDIIHENIYNNGYDADTRSRMASSYYGNILLIVVLNILSPALTIPE